MSEARVGGGWAARTQAIGVGAGGWRGRRRAAWTQAGGVDAGGGGGRWGRSQAEAGRFAATGRAKGCIVSAHGGAAEVRAFFLCVAELNREDGRAQTSAYELVGRMVALLSMF